MTNNQLTDERVTLVIERLEHYACNLKWTNVRGAQDLLAAADGLRELQERRKAAMDSEPVAWTDAEELSDLKRDGYAAMLSLARKDCECADPRRQILLFTHPAPSRQRDQVRQEHSEWSQATFGNVSPVGPLKHLSKEALEAAAEPGDLSEWADMQFLLWDAQRRAGITDDQITQAMIDKLAVNKQREWPEPKDGEPRLHIKEQPAPVVLDEKDKTVDADDHPLLWSFNEGWNACRAAMLAAAPHDTPALNSVQSVVTVPGKWIPVSERMPEVGDIVLTAMGGAVNVGEMECSAANCRFFTSVISGRELPATHWMPLPAAPQEAQGE
ncbi:DUF550 domain-containing protein [Klebsiella pneumoniae]|nr:DUF550 domain-containing protein [Klebsiella pneumoniae]